MFVDHIQPKAFMHLNNLRIKCKLKLTEVQVVVVVVVVVVIETFKWTRILVFLWYFNHEK